MCIRDSWRLGGLSSPEPWRLGGFSSPEPLFLIIFDFFKMFKNRQNIKFHIPPKLRDPAKPPTFQNNPKFQKSSNLLNFDPDHCIRKLLASASQCRHSRGLKPQKCSIFFRFSKPSKIEFLSVFKAVCRKGVMMVHLFRPPRPDDN